MTSLEGEDCSRSAHSIKKVMLPHWGSLPRYSLGKKMFYCFRNLSSAEAQKSWRKKKAGRRISGNSRNTVCEKICEVQKAGSLKSCLPTHPVPPFPPPPPPPRSEKCRVTFTSTTNKSYESKVKLFALHLGEGKSSRPIYRKVARVHNLTYGL